MGSQGKELASDLPLALRGSPYSPLRWEPLPRLSGHCVSQCWREERETVNERLSSAADKGCLGASLGTVHTSVSLWPGIWPP